MTPDLLFSICSALVILPIGLVAYWLIRASLRRHLPLMTGLVS